MDMNKCILLPQEVNMDNELMYRVSNKNQLLNFILKNLFKHFYFRPILLASIRIWLVGWLVG